MSINPAFKVLPFETLYNFVNNMPILGNDKKGDICVPCIVILIGLVTIPELAMAPAPGEDLSKIRVKHEKLRVTWIANSILGGGVSRSGAFAGQFFKSVLQQATFIGIGNAGIEGWNSLSENRKYDIINNVLIETLGDLDYFDAYIERYNLGKFDKAAKNLLTATDDLTAEEASMLGLGKDALSVTVDAAFGALFEMTEDQFKNIKRALGKTN